MEIKRIETHVIYANEFFFMWLGSNEGVLCEEIQKVISEGELEELHGF